MHRRLFSMGLHPRSTLCYPAIFLCFSLPLSVSTLSHSFPIRGKRSKQRTPTNTTPLFSQKSHLPALPPSLPPSLPHCIVMVFDESKSNVGCYKMMRISPQIIISVASKYYGVFNNCSMDFCLLLIWHDTGRPSFGMTAATVVKLQRFP